MATKRDLSKRTKLVGLTVKEVSLVKSGADDRAPVAIFKSADLVTEDVLEPWQEVMKAMGSGAQTTLEVMENREAWEDWCELRSAFTESMYQILEKAPPADRLGLLQKSVAEFTAKAKEILPLLPAPEPLGKALDGLSLAEDVDELQVADAALSRAVEVIASAVGKAAPAKEEEPMAFEIKSLSSEGQAAFAEIEKRAATAEALAKDLQSKLEVEVAKNAPKPSEEDVMKGLPEPIRKRFEALEAQAKKSEEDLAKARDAQATADAEVMAKSAAGIPGAQVAELAPVMKEIVAKVGKDTAEKIVAVLKSAANALAQSTLFTTVGKGGPAPAAGSAQAEMDSKAQEIAKSRSLPFAKAYDEAVKENKDLANRAMLESSTPARTN